MDDRALRGQLAGLRREGLFARRAARGPNDGKTRSVARCPWIGGGARIAPAPKSLDDGREQARRLRELALALRGDLWETSERMGFRLDCAGEARACAAGARQGGGSAAGSGVAKIAPRSCRGLEVAPKR